MKFSRIETLAIGDELLTGKIADTNSAFVASRFFKEFGIRLQRQNVIADDVAQIEASIDECASRCDAVICFGGLGPTSDDKTAEVVAKMLGGGISPHEFSRQRLTAYYAERGRVLTPAALKQTLYPTLTTPLANLVGMAPGFEMKWKDCRLYFLPGVPAEMRGMFDGPVLAALKSSVLAERTDRIGTRIWRCIGVWESELQMAMNEVEKELPSTSWLGYRTSFPENHLTLYSTTSQAPAFAESAQKIDGLLERWCYSKSDQTLEDVVLAGLKARNWNLALAESCTGGLVCQRLTRVPGSSEVVWGGVTCYQNAAKQEMLGIQLASPTDAVSRECTRDLAEALAKKSGCDVTAAVTGYLGPAGGTEKDPLGKVYFAAWIKGQIFEVEMLLPKKDRVDLQWGAATHLLNLIRTGMEKS